MKKFIKNLRLLCPKDTTVIVFLLGCIAGYLILQIAIVLTHSRIVSESEYVNITDVRSDFITYKTSVDALLDTICAQQPDYFLDVLTEQDVFQTFIEAEHATKQQFGN